MSDDGRPDTADAAEPGLDSKGIDSKGLDPEFTAELGRLRAAIDEVDREILGRLNLRAGLVKQVGELKARTGRAPVYVASRERDLIAELTGANAGPFPDEGIQHVFREIISATRSLEEVVRVAFLGPEGTFSHQAAVRQFGALAELVIAAHIPDVFDLCERGRAHYGVVPVENTTEGAVTECFDSLVESEVTICGELMLDIRQNLLTNAGSLDRIKRIGSHPQPLAQCRDWLHRDASRRGGGRDGEYRRAAARASRRTRRDVRRDRQRGGRRGLRARHPRAVDRGPQGQQHPLLRDRPR